MTSPTKNCDYQFKFDLNGRIVGFEIMGENTFSSEESRNLFARVPETVGALKQFALKHKIELTEIMPDLSFVTFWTKYGKVGVRSKAEKAWERLSDKNKALAMNYINKYKQSLGSISQAYGATYLNNQYWIK